MGALRGVPINATGLRVFACGGLTKTDAKLDGSIKSVSSSTRTSPRCCLSASKYPDSLVPVISSDALSSVFEGQHDTIRNYVLASEARNTTRARKFDWEVFSAWCESKRMQTLPAEPSTVVAFLADQSKGTATRPAKAVATVVRYARSINAVHKLKNLPSPTETEAVKIVLRGIRRGRGVQQNRKAALTAEIVSEILEKGCAGNSLSVLRDRAVILLGLTTGMRRSELCAINIEDIKLVKEGLLINIKRSKTDQEGVGRVVAVPRLKQRKFCPVQAVEAWISTLGRESGPLFCGFLNNGKHRKTRLSSQAINSIVKRVAKLGGLRVEDFGAHSLRAGFVTTARQQGVDWASIMAQTGHKQLETVKGYARYTPDTFVETRVGDIFNGDAFDKKSLK